jgi:tetratricopeptide (TPR) repeat protein
MKSKILQISLIGAVFAAGSFSASAQKVGGDLGSSNGLFGNPPAKATSASKSGSAKSVKKSTPSSAKSKSAGTAKKTNAKPATKPTVAKKDKPESDRAKKTAKGSGKSSPTVAKNTGTAQRTKNQNLITTISAGSSGVKTSVTTVEAQFEQAIEEGNIARDERNYTAAEAAYRKAITLKQRDSRAVYGLGNLYSDLQRWEDAERSYRKAIELEPGVPESYIALSFVLTQPIAGMSVGDRYQEAEKMADKAIAIDSTNAVAYDQKGVALELQGVISEDTERAYREAIRLAPEYSLAQAHLGRLLGKRNMRDAAKAQYQKAINLARDVPSMILVAEAIQGSQTVEAEQLLRRALRLDAKNPMALMLLGEVLMRLQRYTEAERFLQESVGISSEAFTPHSKLGEIYLALRRFDDAEQAFSNAFKVASMAEKKKLAGLQGFTGVGDGYAATRRFRDAVRAFTRAKEIDGQNMTIQNKLAAAQRNAY